MHLPEWALKMNHWASIERPFLFILDFEILQPVVLALDDIVATGIRFEIQSSSQSEGLIANSFSRSYDQTFTSDPISFEIYQKGFNQVMQALHAGDTYLLNLCYTTRLTGINDLGKIFDSVQAPYKLFMPGQFVIFSPEKFISISEGMIKTFPMKGTIDAAIPDAANVLLADIKEQEEHATVVDLLRNDLSIVAREVAVNRYRYISEIKTSGKTLLQCSSEISGVLEDEYKKNLGSTFYKLLPAGSITGAPKKRTVELIKEIEPEPRGYYTGVFGIFDGQSVDSAVMIRMIEQRQDGFYYRSGGGITYRSNAAQEYQEMLDKVYIPG